MKKTVIKRRKRVPAAPGGNSPPGQHPYPSSAAGSPTGLNTAEQAAAEALVTVGWGRAMPMPQSIPDSHSDDMPDEDAPKRKRAKRSRSTRDKEKDNGDSENQHRLDGDESPLAEHTSASRKGDRIPTQYYQAPLAQGPQVLSRMEEAMYLPPFPNGGIELPPLNAALLRRDGIGKEESHVRSREYSPGPMSGMNGSRGTSSSPMVHHHPLPPTSSFFHPHANGHLPHQQPQLLHAAHSMLRGPSPLSPDAHWHPSQIMNVPAQLVVPVPPTRAASAHSTSSRTPPLPTAVDVYAHHSVYVTSPTVVPSVTELERHYAELRSERKRLEEVLYRTDRLMAGLKRGIDEMRGGLPQSGQVAEASHSAVSPRPPSVLGRNHPPTRPPSTSGSQGGATRESPLSSSAPASVPLRRQDKPKTTERVWVANEESYD